jgi:hypothetical protein
VKEGGEEVKASEARTLIYLALSVALSANLEQQNKLDDMAQDVSVEPPRLGPFPFFLPTLVLQQSMFTPDLSRHPQTTLAHMEAQFRAVRQIRLNKQQMRRSQGTC